MSDPKVVLNAVANHAFVGMLYTLVKQCAVKRDALAGIDDATAERFNSHIRFLNSFLAGNSHVEISRRYREFVERGLNTPLTDAERAIISLVHASIETLHLYDALIDGVVPREWQS